MRTDPQQIVGLGGRPDDAMLDHVLGLARGPRVLYVPTASNEDPGRRPVYRELVRDGFPPGLALALEDAAGAHYVGTELHEVVASLPGSGGYRVGADGEVELPARLLV
jgi:hypothetical protein